MTEALGVVDALNQRTMSLVVDEYAAIVHESLNEAERNALDSLLPHIKDKRILDIGVGAGRTVKGLCDISADYIGVDYMQEMVDYCRGRYPQVRFEKADARAMPQFADASFDLIVFACNGISMVDHAGRLAIIKEVRRLLAPGGYFLFSTCNRNSPRHRRFLLLPPFYKSKNPLKLLVRSMRFVGETAYRLMNRLRYRPHEVITGEYAIINDVCHHYRTMLYFISLKEQRRQLEALGFAPHARAYHLNGEIISDDSTDGTLTLVATLAA